MAKATKKQIAKSGKKSPKSAKLPNSLKIFESSLRLLLKNWRLFLTITLIYGVLTILLVRGSGSLNLSQIKDNFRAGLNGSYSSLATGFSLFSYLIGSAGSSASASGGTYQTFLIIILSLVVIWALRQVLAGEKIRARDAFYKGTYPLVQFSLVLIVVATQLLPLLLGSWLYSTTVSSGVAITEVEKLLWGIISFLLILGSLYMISSSLFALYIVSLPNMTPMKALRSAKQLVARRRWSVLRKILFLPFALLIIGAILFVPMVLYLTVLAEWIFFALSMFTLVVVHAYMYTLYRELL